MKETLRHLDNAIEALRRYNPDHPTIPFLESNRRRLMSEWLGNKS